MTEDLHQSEDAVEESIRFLTDLARQKIEAQQNGDFEENAKKSR